MSAGYDGNGNYIRGYNWSADKANGIDITASRFDTEDNGFATALSNCVTRDGQGKMAADFIADADSTRSIGSSVVQWLAGFIKTLTSETVNATTVNGALQIPITLAETAAGVTPIDYSYEPGDVRRYGSILNGVADDTIALQNWAKVGGNLTFPVAQTAFITAEIPLVSNTTITAIEGATISTATHDISLLTASGKSNITIRGLKFKRTSAGTAVNVGDIKLVTSTDCFIEDCEFEGSQFAGIMGSAISRCTIRGNYIHDPLGAMQDSADIYIESSATITSSYNVIDGNFCYGTGFEFGIVVWDPYSGVLPIHNLVCNNRIGAHSGYGILIYMPDAGDSYNQIIGNHVQDISAFAGLPTPNTDSGAGIYLAGAGIGGTQIIGNTINNCCITTSTTSLAPAGIGVSGGNTAGQAPVIVQGNTIEGMTKYWGILATGMAGGIAINGNTIRMPASNTTGDAIKVANSNNWSVTGNIIVNLNTTTNQLAIAIWAQGAANANGVVANNTINGGYQQQIRTIQSGGNATTNLVISGNVLNGGGTSCIPLTLDSASAANVMVANNTVRANTVAAVSQTACTNVRYSCNYFNSTGTVTLSFSGVNTGSYYDKTNFGSGNGAGVVNGGTGLIIEQSGSAAPVAGTWAVGDKIEQSVPVVGNPKGWYCTVAGAPGTWVSTGTL